MAATIVVGLGCDHIPASEIADEVARSKKPVELVTIETAGGYREAVDEGVKIAHRLAADDSKIKKNTFGLYAGGIVEGRTTEELSGDQLIHTILSVASGALTQTEENLSYREPLALYTTGPLL